MNIACKFEWGISPYNINALSSNKMDIVVPLGAMIPSLSRGGSVNVVESVNGKTGKHITLEASDLDTYTRSEVDARIPTKLSDLGNDVDFVTEGDVDVKLESKQDTLPTNGDGTKYLSDDGYYKEIQPSIDAYTKAETDTLLDDKVDKEAGKGLSTNDYSSADKTKVSKIVTNGLGDKYLSDDGVYKAVSGGGGMSMTVIDYDAADPANFIAQTLTLADFVPVDNSAVIDAANNQIAVGTPIDVQTGYGYQYIAAKLDKIPTEGTIRLDFSNYEDYSLGLITKTQFVSLDSFMSELLFSKWQSYQPLQPMSAIVNTLNSSLEDVLHLKSKVADKPDGSPTIDETIENIASLPNLDMTFTISNMLNFMLDQYNMTYQELVDYAKVVMGFSEEEAIAYVEAQRAIRALISGSLYMILPDDVTEMHIVLRPKHSDQPTTIDPTWVASVEVNASYISEWVVPTGLPDGTYLKINGQCTLLGHKCASGDVVQVYDNATKGLLFKGAAA